MAWIAAIIAGAASLAGSEMNKQSAQQANRTNVDLSKETRDWETQMSNTAVQRRADDIEKAGGNRALAFVNGTEASTPTMTAPQVQAPQSGAGLQGVAQTALQLQAVRQAKANTALTLQTARKTKVDADNAERLGPYNADTERGQAIANLESTELENKRKEIANSLSARQLDQFNSTYDAVVATAKQQAARGKIDLDALKTIAKGAGVSDSAFKPLFDYINAHLVEWSK